MLCRVGMWDVGVERLSLEDEKPFASYGGMREMALLKAGDLSVRLPARTLGSLNLPPRSWPRSPQQCFSKRFCFQYEVENSRAGALASRFPFVEL